MANQTHARFGDCDPAPLTPFATNEEVIAEACSIRDNLGLVDTLNLAWALAQRMLIRRLGRQWHLDHVAGATTGFYSTGLRSESDNDLVSVSMLRLIRLAENIHNLEQRRPQVAERIARIARGELEAFAAELSMLAVLEWSGLKYRLRSDFSTEPTHDLDIEIDGGEVVAVELKSKADGTEMSAHTVAKSLSKSGRQTKNAPSRLVMLHLPQAWITNPLVEMNVRAGCRLHFSGSKRCAGVLVHSTRVSQYGTIPAEEFELLAVYNRFAAKDTTSASNCLTVIARAVVLDDWFSIESVVNSALAEKG